MRNEKNTSGIRLARQALLLVCLAGTISFVVKDGRAGDWREFRGPGGSAVSEEQNLPIKWSATEGLRWKAELPGKGLSNPVIAGGRVYVTATSGYRERRLHVLCFDAASGNKLWERQFTSTGNTSCHPKTCMAAPTPVTDGKHVFALFASTDVAALDSDGNLLWYRSLIGAYPTITNQVGMAASPALYQDILIIPMENVGESFVAGLDKFTGQTRWKLERDKTINWATPLVTTVADKPAVVLQTNKDVTCCDPATGKVRWTLPTESTSDICSPTAGDGLLFIPGRKFYTLKPAPSDEQMPEVVWTSSRLNTSYPSPVFYQKRVYVLTGSNVTCVDAVNGRELWKERVKAPFAATPVLADGKLYILNEDGIATVLQLGDKPKILATNTIKDTFLATPAIADGAIYLRSDSYLYCIGSKKEK